MTSETNSYNIINEKCIFFESCVLPKDVSLCNHFPEFTICPEYETKKNKVLS